jgi:hypothetical protein
MPKKKDPRAKLFRMVVILVILLSLGAFAAVRLSEKQSGPDPRVAFAQCLKDKGVKFFGAYWCPHCSQQKKLFGSKAMSVAPYVECALPGNPQGQTQECKDAGVQSYPTWAFPDGSRATGEQTFKVLSEKSGCAWTEQP